MSRFFCLIALIALAAAPVQAAVEINDARFNNAAQTIEVDVTYQGCNIRGEIMTLEKGACREKAPVDCDMNVVEPDQQVTCRMLQDETLSFPLKQAGLDTDYFKGATLTFRNPQGEAKSVNLPK